MLINPKSSKTFLLLLGVLGDEYWETTSVPCGCRLRRVLPILFLCSSYRSYGGVEVTVGGREVLRWSGGDSRRSGVPARQQNPNKCILHGPAGRVGWGCLRGATCLMLSGGDARPPDVFSACNGGKAGLACSGTGTKKSGNALCRCIRHCHSGGAV